MTAVVGGLTAIANEWRRLKLELDDVDRKERELQNCRDVIVTRLKDVAARLRERVGRNVPTKAFQVEGGTVIVDSNAGIKFLEFARDE